MINYNIVKDLLMMSMIIYNYGKQIDAIKNESSYNDYMNSILTNREYLKKLNISETRKNVLMQIANDNKLNTNRIFYFIDDKKTDLQACITYNTKYNRICVIFRGSESISDWYYDFQIKLFEKN